MIIEPNYSINVSRYGYHYVSIELKGLIFKKDAFKILRDIKERFPKKTRISMRPLLYIMLSGGNRR